MGITVYDLNGLPGSNHVYLELFSAGVCDLIRRFIWFTAWHVLYECLLVSITWMDILGT